MTAPQWPNPQWPAHYTAADIELIGRIQAWIVEHSYSQAALARLARISPSSLNQILKGVYATPPAKLLGNVESAMRHADEASQDAMTPVETSVWRLAHLTCDNARRFRYFAVFTGYVGTGKTFAVKHYAASRPNTHLVEATPTMTPQSLVKLLAREVAGYDGKGSIDDRFRAVVDTLRNTDSLVVVDEAETLTPHQLHTLRRIRDLANIGIVLCGTEYLHGLIKPEHGQFDQIRSRTGFWPETIQGINALDAVALVQAGFGGEEVPEDVVKRMFAYSQGSARMLVEGLIAAVREYRRGATLDMALVDEVAKKSLRLKLA